MSIWFSWGSCSAVAAAIFALTLIANASSSSSQADWLTRRQATNSGLCRIYSYNVERQSTALSWEIGQFGSVQQTFATPERRYFICCQDDGTETACRDKTYQRPHTGTLKPEVCRASHPCNILQHFAAELSVTKEYSTSSSNDSSAREFCRGEVVLPGDATRHWTEDETDLFTGGDLMYCGGCCGQHLASDACNVQFSIETNYDGRDGVCDRWISCFVDQCRNTALDIIAGRPLKCSVPPPPYPKIYDWKTLGRSNYLVQSQRKQEFCADANLSSGVKVLQAKNVDKSEDGILRCRESPLETAFLSCVCRVEKSTVFCIDNMECSRFSSSHQDALLGCRD